MMALDNSTVVTTMDMAMDDSTMASAMSPPQIILLVVVVLDILPLATVYGIYGIVLFIGITIFYPIYLIYRLVWRRRRTKKGAVKEKDTESKPRTKKSKVSQWVKQKINTIIFTLYGESHIKIAAFLENETTYGVAKIEDTWRQTQLSWLAHMLRINALTLLLSSVLALWERFLVERTLGECDEERYCYIGATDAGRWHRVPIDDCSNVTNEDQIICFKFVYAVGDAVGLAGGILTYGIFLMKFGAIIMISWFKLLKKCCARHKKVFRTITFIIQQLPITVMLVAAGFALAFQRYRDFSRYGFFVEAFGIAAIPALVIATPWSVLADKALDDKEEESKKKATDKKGLLTVSDSTQTKQDEDASDSDTDTKEEVKTTKV